MCVWSEAVRSDSIKFGKCNTLSLKNVSLSLGEMEHNQSHSRESIKITHNRVKRSRLFLNAFMRTLRRANAISAPRKSATREFCKWRTEEHPRETKKNFERDDDEQRERERERGEKQKRKGRRDARCSFSLLLLLLTCGIFFREYARWSRAIEDVLCIYTVVVVLDYYILLWCCRRRRRLSRGTREKSYDFWCTCFITKTEVSFFLVWRRNVCSYHKPFLFEFFQFFLISPYSPFHCVVVLREYTRVRRTRTTTD